MKRFSESKPIIVVAKVVLPIQVRLAISIVPPHIARVGIAIKRMYKISSVSLPIQKYFYWGLCCILFVIIITQHSIPSIFIF
jgi:hypothetical protein